MKSLSRGVGVVTVAGAALFGLSGPAQAAPSVHDVTAARSVPQPGHAPAAPTCVVVSQSTYNLTVRCTYVDGYSHYQLRIQCRDGRWVRSPWVRVGQTTWAICPTAAGPRTGATEIQGSNR